jgi:hypothetical protein
MSDQIANPTATTGGKGPLLFLGGRSWRLASIVSATMVMLALLGVAFTNARYDFAQTYWICLVPVFGLMCVGTAWARTRKEGGLRMHAVIRQVLHWVGIGIALWLDFLVRRTGEETATAAGLNAVLLLALGCFLAGVHLDWLFAFVGILIVLALVLVAKAEQYLWIIFVIGGLAIALMVALWWQLRAKKGVVAAPSGTVGS